MKKYRILAVTLACVTILAGCGQESNNLSAVGGTELAVEENLSATEGNNDMFTDRDMASDYDVESCIEITLNGSSAVCSDKCVSISDSVVTITEEGTYLLSGTLDDGMILIDAGKKDKIQLVLNGVNISSSTSAAIYVRQADKVFITMVEGMENVLSNGGSYAAIDDNNIDAVIFSKDDLTINGEGTLTIVAKEGHGIVSKDDLVLVSGTYKITAASHGIEGKDSVRIAGGSYTIISGKDGIHAKNSDDEARGFVYIADGDFQINAGDDGIHADNAVIIAGGKINIEQSYEGIEGKTIDISGGEIDIVSSDDGLNAAGGKDGSGFGGRGGDMFGGTEGVYLSISGGKLHINASGDGIDSNGDLYVSGGEIYVSGPTNNGNGALDYDGNAAITGGIVIAAGSAGMAQNFGSNSTQGTMLVNIAGSAGNTIILSDSSGKELVSWQADKSFSCVVISMPDVVQGSTYTVSTGDSSVAVTMESLVYGSSGGMGGGGRGERPGDNGSRPGGMGGRP